MSVIINLPKKQKGVAVLFTILMTGVAILGLTMRISSSQKSQQQIQRVTNGSISSQIRAWEASEIIRLYLNNLSDPASLNLGDLPVSGLNGITANVISNTVSGSNRRIIIEIKSNVQGASSTILESVYQLGTTVVSTPVTGLKNVMNFKGSTVFDAGVKFTGVTNQTINVDGDVTLAGGANLNGNSIYTTGNVSISGGINVKNIFSEKNVNITGCTVFGNPDYIKAIGNIYIDSCGINTSLIQSNGTTYIGSSGTHSIVKSNGDLTLVGGNITNAFTNGITTVGSGGGVYSNLKSKGNVNQNGNIISNVYTDGTYTGGGAGGTVSNISAKNNVNINSNININSVTTGSNLNMNYSYSSIGTLKAKNNLLNTNWGSSITGTIGGLKLNITDFSNINVTTVSGFDPTPAPVDTEITLLTPSSPSSPKIDVNDYKGQANYIFSYESGNIMVETQNLSGLTDGQKYYYLNNVVVTTSGFICTNGSISSGWTPTCNTWTNGNRYNDVICPTNTYDASTCKLIGRQYSWPMNNHITYSGGTFKISDENSGNTTLAPGILFFKGNVDFYNTRVNNTILATGNITTSSGDIETNASNNVNYANTCQTSYPKPLNLCDTSSRKNPDIGNVALMAGSYSGTTFSGGVIDIGTGKIGGTIIAGDVIRGGGGAMVKGYLVASKQGSGSNNHFSGGVNVDLTGMEASFDPSKVPIVTGSTNTNTGGGTTSMFWSRYK